MKDQKTAAITGAGGLVGSALTRRLVRNGWRVIRFVRGCEPKNQDELRWDPPESILDPKMLDGIDAVINLAGESVGGFWTKKRKRRIYESRIKSTELLVREIKKLSTPPKVFVSASAIGYYGPVGGNLFRENVFSENVLTEDSPPGEGFLAEVCRDWESAALELSDLGVRVVLSRIALVLDAEAPAVRRMLTPFRMGIGGTLGDGKQWMSWITLADLIRGFEFVLENVNVTGPCNFSAPEPVTNAEYTRAIGQVLRRPTVFGIPRLVLRAFLREQADEMLLASQRAIPKKLLDNGFHFSHDNIERALAHILKEGKNE